MQSDRKYANPRQVINLTSFLATITAENQAVAVEATVVVVARVATKAHMTAQEAEMINTAKGRDHLIATTAHHPTDIVPLLISMSYVHSRWWWWRRW